LRADPVQRHFIHADWLHLIGNLLRFSPTANARLGSVAIPPLLFLPAVAANLAAALSLRQHRIGGSSVRSARGVGIIIVHTWRYFRARLWFGPCRWVCSSNCAPAC
jgi:membrane associated rhomboid family serine protease